LDNTLRIVNIDNKNVNSIFQSFRHLEPAKQDNLLILFVAGLLFWISSTSLMPTLPTYIQDVGGTTRQVGVVMGSFAIGLLLCRTWMGQLADRQSRKLVVLIGAAVAGVGPLGYLLVQSIPGLMAIRAFHGISIAAFTIGYTALVVDLSPLKQRGEIIGYMNLSVPIGMAIGPAVGGFLVEYSGYPLVFSISAASGFLALILATQIKETSQKNISLDPKDSLTLSRKRTLIELFQSHSLVIPTLILLFIGLLFGTLIAFLPLFIRELKIDFNVGLFYSAAAMASFAVRIFVGRASDRYGRGLFITLSLFCYLFSMLLIASAHTPSAFLFAAILEGSGAGVLVPVMLALISDRSYENERGQAYAFCLGGFDLGIAIGGPVLGAFLGVLSYQGLFLLASSMAVLALILFITQSSKNLAHSFRFALGQEKDLFTLN
jgi:MFS family permease